MMNLPALKDKLLAAARRHPPSGDVPFGFEKRMMARLRSRQPDDLRTLWGQALWRGALASVVAALMLSALTLIEPPSDPTTQLSQVYDSTVDIAADQLTDSW